MFTNKTRTCCSFALLAWNRTLFASALSSQSFLVSSRLPSLHRTSLPYSTSPLAMSSDTEVRVGDNLSEVRERIAAACEGAGRNVDDVRLVAVSKTKPLELIQQAYASGQRVFGENYAQELVEKAGTLNEPDVQWHFIGGLQSNKANMLVKGVVPYGKLVVETVASLKVAKKLNNAMGDVGDDKEPLGVFVQVNTSGEESKSGVSTSEAVELCQQISKDCDRLQLMGVMTIGAPGDEECLSALVACRDHVASELNVDPKDLEVSMGMSGDYEMAIQKGSTNVRVGSTIFGARDYSNKR